MAASTTSRRPAPQSRRTPALQTPKSALPPATASETSISGAAFPDGDVETSVAVEALLKRLIVAGELKLMLPFELQRHCLERNGRVRCRQRQGSPNDQQS